MNKIYKLENIKRNMERGMNRRGMSKKAQLTIFIIIAIVIVAVLAIVFWPNLKIIVTNTSTPQAYFESCVKDKAKEAIDLASKRGGSINPVNAIMYGGENVEYLCYTNEYYKTCTMQQPMLKRHVEYEVSRYIEDDVKSCVNSFKTEFERRGYQVSAGNPSISTEIVPENVIVNIKISMTITKETTEKYNLVKIPIKSKMYDFVMLSDSILNWEARYGDSDPLSFMVYYPDLKIEKLKQTDGSKIYILSNLDTKESFSFASRSLSWPGGLGIGEKVR